MADTPKREGPRFLRVLVIVFSCVLGFLVYWFLDFVFDDIETLRGPDYVLIERSHLDQGTVQQEGALDRELAYIRGQMSEEIRGFSSLRTVSDDPNACPTCGTMLYEKCASCSATRHSLLPFCEKCGAAKEVVAPAASA